MASRTASCHQMIARRVDPDLAKSDPDIHEEKEEAISMLYWNRLPLSNESLCRPTSPFLSPFSSSTGSLDKILEKSRSLSPSAFAHLLKVPSLLRNSPVPRDAAQPSSGSLSNLHTPALTDEEQEQDQEESDHVPEIRIRSRLSSKRRRGKRERTRPSTPPALCTELAAVSHKLAQIGLRDRYHMPERHIEKLMEA